MARCEAISSGNSLKMQAAHAIVSSGKGAIRLFRESLNPCRGMGHRGELLGINHPVGKTDTTRIPDA
jgi:hypothetical protein